MSGIKFVKYQLLQWANIVWLHEKTNEKCGIEHEWKPAYITQPVNQHSAVLDI